MRKLEQNDSATTWVALITMGAPTDAAGSVVNDEWFVELWIYSFTAGVNAAGVYCQSGGLLAGKARWDETLHVVEGEIPTRVLKALELQLRG